MLETIREYGLERLTDSGDEAPVRTAHTVYFLDLAEAALPNLSGPEEGSWSEVLEAEQDNVRAALTRTIDASPHLACRFVIALTEFWCLRGYLAEARDWAERARVVSGDVPALIRAQLLDSAAMITYQQADFEVSQQLATEALPLFRETGDQKGISTSRIR